MSEAIQRKHRKEAEKLARLYRLYVMDRSPATCDALLQACLPQLRKAVEYHSRRMHPSFLASGTFAEDAFTLAQVKFWRGIHSIRNPQQICAWLNRVAHNAVADELKPWVGRSKKGPARWEPIDREKGGHGD